MTMLDVSKTTCMVERSEKSQLLSEYVQLNFYHLPCISPLKGDAIKARVLFTPKPPEACDSKMFPLPKWVIH